MKVKLLDAVVVGVLVLVGLMSLGIAAIHFFDGGMIKGFPLMLGALMLLLGSARIVQVAKRK